MRDTNGSNSSLNSRKSSSIKKNTSLVGLTSNTPRNSSKGNSTDSDDIYMNPPDSHRSRKQNTSIKIDLDSIKKDALTKEKSNLKSGSASRNNIVQLQTGPGSIVMNDYSNVNFDTNK